MNYYFSNFHTVPPQGFLRTFFLSLRISQSNKICRVCFCCNLCEVDSHIDCTIPATAEEAALQKYGEVEVKVLNKQYGGDSDAALIHSSALEGEWYDLRSYLYLSCRTMSMGDVLNLLATNTTLHCTLSNFTKLALVCLCFPLTTTDCERAFPTMCRVKTRLRGQMINKTLNHWHENID